MNVITIAQDYIMKMLSSKSAAGMKVLLMDKETAGIVSLVINQITALQKEVYLFERIDNPKREPLLHLRCIAFLRPTEENFRLLAAEVSDPKYREYHLFFSNIIGDKMLDKVAEKDDHHVVIQVQEFYADFFAINPDFYTLYTSSPAMSIEEEGWADTEGRIVDGLLSVMLAMKRLPIMRYSAGSIMCKNVTQRITDRINAERELFGFPRTDPPPLMLILDRRFDPVSPLLFQWTYQAMVHEVFGLVKNRVDFSSCAVPIKDDVLSCEQDEFFKEAMYMNYGELGDAVKGLVGRYIQKKNGMDSMAQKKMSLEEIKQMMDQFPELRKIEASQKKHLALGSELKSYIRDHKMLAGIGQIEQDLACHQDPVNASRQLYEALEMPDLPAIDKLHLAMLYVLRYESEVNLPELKERLVRAGVSPDDTAKLDILLIYSNSQNRGVDLFGTNTVFSRASQVVRGIIGPKESFLLDHNPYVVNIIDAASKGKLKDTQFPLVMETVPQIPGQTPAAAAAIAGSAKVNEIIVFIIGGATFEEACHVAQINNNPSPTNPVKVILGGTTILNTKIFLHNLGATKL